MIMFARRAAGCLEKIMILLMVSQLAIQMNSPSAQMKTFWQGIDA
jgi:hypothetical protein